MKRFTWVSLLAAAIIVCATGTASAQSTKTWTYELMPADSVLPDAGGLVTVTISGPYHGILYGQKVTWYNESIRFEAWGLEPLTLYNLYEDSSANILPYGFGWTDNAGDIDETFGFLLTGPGSPKPVTPFYVTDEMTGDLVLTSQ